MAGRVLQVSSTFRRSVQQLGVQSGSAAYRAVSGTMRALAANVLPGPGDYETWFAPGRAHVRRVSGHNVWILYRFDDERLFVMTARSEPPVPLDE